MKLSTAMIKGFAQVGRQCRGALSVGPSHQPRAVCAIGAARLGVLGTTNSFDLNGSRYLTSLDLDRQATEFEETYRVTIMEVNDRGVSIPDIIGMVQAAGL